MNKDTGSGRWGKASPAIFWYMLLFIQICIFTLAAVELGLCGHILANSNDSEDIWVLKPGGNPDTIIRYIYPHTLNSGPTWAITATGIGGTADALLVFIILILGRKKLTRKRVMAPLLIILTVSVIRSVAAVGYGWSQDRSAVLELGDLSRFSRWATFWKGFTPFGWSKQMQAFVYEDWVKHELEQMCQEIRTTWTLSMVIALLDFVALAVGVCLWITARRELGKRS